MTIDNPFATFKRHAEPLDHENKHTNLHENTEYNRNKNLDFLRKEKKRFLTKRKETTCCAFLESFLLRSYSVFS